MAFSASLRSPSYSQLSCSIRCNKKHHIHNRIDFVSTNLRKGRGHLWKTVKSVLNDNRPSFNNYGAAESTRVLRERLFEQTQMLEHQMVNGARGEYFRDQEVRLGFNLRILESDLQAALTSLKKKEEHLQEVERMVLLENNKLNLTKEELARQESKIASTRSKYEKLEEEMNEASVNLVSQGSQMEEVKLRLREQDQEIATFRIAITLKEEEMEKMKIDLEKKSQEAAYVNSELNDKARLLNEANEVMNKQEVELQELRKVVEEKEEQLHASLAQRKLEEEKMKDAEGMLEKQVMEWLLAQEELKRLRDDASRHTHESNETLEDFGRVKALLNDVRSELVSSQQSLASSRNRIEEQERLLEEQLAELVEQRESVMSYTESLKNAQIEMESERVKLRIAEARNEDLEWALSMENALVKELQEELKKERTSLQQAVQELSLLKEELEKKSAEYGELGEVLRVKESQLVDAKLQIQHLKSEKAYLQVMLEEKDLELSDARKMLVELNHEIYDLKMLMNNKETQLIDATNMLKEKDEHVKIIESKLNDTNLKAFEAETAVEWILELTNKLVSSIKDEEFNSLRPKVETGNDLLEQLMEEPTNEMTWLQKRLENELELTKENLKTKEMEVLAAHRAITIKDEELKATRERLDAKDEELKKARANLTDVTNLKRLHSSVRERINEKSIGELELEAEAATSALHKLAEMSIQLFNKAIQSVEANNYINIMPNNVNNTNLASNINFTMIKTGVVRISALTEQLVREAGIVVVN
ncbi:PREDICTED: golgin subfamily A member 6-like protein 22 isoform X2 [Lupinus angustifolius]|uniref:golgin subfamily A member 6-like protein 22 isoform X2 n=1 Tax=Lupinus angustifolius TaxID=3871 RepID=UPI00092EEBD2|nr:PREDICTED: golgin subfamily A member 6-like protein 22 isoform X2 [Lupinus angustifolius]